MATLGNFSERSITNFRDRLVGGGSRSNLFEVNITLPDGVLGNLDVDADMRFMIKAAVIPASNIGSIPVPFRGRVLPVAGDRTFDPWTVTVINDTNFKIRDAMEKWSNFINDLQTSQGSINPEEYQTAGFVKQLSREGENSPGEIDILREYRYEGIYPNTVSDIALDYGATDQIEEFQVTFNYLFYSVVGGSTVNSAGGSLI